METRRKSATGSRETREPGPAVGSEGRVAAGRSGRVAAMLSATALAAPILAVPMLAAAILAATSAATRPAAAQTPDAGQSTVPSLAAVAAFEGSSLAPVVDRFSADWGALQRKWADLPYSPARQQRVGDFLAEWADALAALPVAADDVEGSIDHTLLSAEIRYRQELLAREGRLLDEVAPLLPFGGEIVELLEIRHAGAEVDGEEMAAALAGLAVAVREADAALRSGAAAGGAGVGGGGQPAPTPIAGLRAVRVLQSYRNALGSWYRHYAGYDPLFTWWASQPFEEADGALGRYLSTLRVRVVGWPEGGEEPIVGDPIGADGMAADLAREMIPYTPTELIALANEEFAWCEEEMLKASRELGFGEDWKAALEHVKTLHAEPGGQPRIVMMLAHEAIDFIEERGLVTVPPLAKEVWRLEMMSPARQRVSPFFLGGEVIRVSFPTDEMTHDEKRMSMRGNNTHFSRATVHHELIPGHHLQGFMTDRYNSHRDLFGTPFWTEGWALYWEMLLWDLGFPTTPEDRVGMLFWRMHRAARIIFSLSFHLEEMTPDEAIAFLVDRVGHEPANATAEVRRSFNGSYSPLYQAAYMLGGLQVRSLHEELVGGGRMTDREFHDTILQGGSMPIEMVRARLLGEAPGRDFRASWRFYGDPM